MIRHRPHVLRTPFRPTTLLFMLSIVVTWSLFIGALYVLLQARGVHLPLVIYWTSEIIAFCALAAQVLSLPVDRHPYGTLVLAQIVGFGVLIMSTINASTPFGVPLYDTHFELGATQQILQSGWPLSTETSQSTIRLVSDWPLLHLFAVAAGFTTGMDLAEVALVTPQAVYVVGFVAIYVTCRRLYPDRQSVSLLVLLASFSTFSIAPDPVFGRNAMGFAFLFLALATLISAHAEGSVPGVGWAVCQTILVGVLTLSHSLSAVLFGIFCGFWFAYPRLGRVIRRWVTSANHPDERTLPGERASFNMLVVSAVFFAADIIWIGADFFSFAVQIIFNASTSGLSVQSTFSASSLRTQFVVAANAVIAFTFLLVTFVHLRKGSTHDHREVDTALIGFGVFIAALTVFMSRLPGLQGFSIPTYRGLGFAWPFIYIVGIHSLEDLLGSSRKGRARHASSFRGTAETGGANRRRDAALAILAIGVLVLIPTTSVAQLNPSVIDHSIPPDYSSGGVRPYFLEGEIMFAQGFSMQGRVVGDQGVYTLLAQYQNQFVYTDLEVLSGNRTPNASEHWLVLRSENQHGLYAPYQEPARLVPVDWDRINESTALSLVYNNGDILAYAVTSP